MRLDDLRETENVDDRRGSGFGGFGPHIAVGGGGLGLVAILALSLFFGVDPSQLLNSVDGGAPMATQSESGPGGPRPDDAAYSFSRKIVGAAEDIWQALLRGKGVA